MAAPHLITGQQGEKLAQEYLRSQGYRILAANFRSRYGEIDLICQKQENIVFVEVRVLKKSTEICPIQTITQNKLQKILKTAAYYLSKHQLWDKPCQIDFIGITYSRGEWKVEHLPEIWKGETVCGSNSSWQPW